MAAQCKNYMKPGGGELVIGGKLTIKDGATIEGLTASDVANLPVAAYQGDAGDGVNSIALLKAEYNELLTKLRAAGLMAAAPTIAVTAQPADLTLTAGSIDSDDKLTAAFVVSNGGTPSYQWYSNASDSNVGGSAVNGATAASYAIPTNATAGTTYYYCVASFEGVTKATDAAAVVVNAGT